ncbi:EpsG family protein [Halomonas sp. GXIMD04776]|uniref:EpsG family protein n=1 Tax=Halomonas sp. GXIMD04776 TaxID=3415605 RepID=UPI003CA4E63D
MLPYIFIFFVISFFSFLDMTRCPKTVRILFFIFCTLILVFFAGFREAGVGADDVNYVSKFYEIPNIFKWMSGFYNYSYSNEKMELGYIALNSFVKVFSSNYTILFLSVSLISVGMAAYNYYKYSRYAFLTLLLFFVHTYLYRDMNQIRAAIAAAIGLFLIFQIHEKNHLKSIVLVFLAGFFHTAALSYFFAYIFSFIKISPKKIFFLLGVSIIVGYIGVSELLLSNLPDLGYITVKLEGYSESVYANTVKLFDLTNIKGIVFLSLFAFFWNGLKYKVPYFETAMSFYTLAVCWRIAFSDFGIFAARIATFFGIVEVVLVPCLAFLLKQKLAAFFIIFLYAFLTLWLNLFVKEGRYPYELAFGA